MSKTAVFHLGRGAKVRYLNNINLSFTLSSSLKANGFKVPHLQGI